MDGPRLSTSGHPHFSSRQTRLLQLGGFVGRCAGAAVGIRVKPLDKRFAAHSTERMRFDTGAPMCGTRQPAFTVRRAQEPRGLLLNDAFAATSWSAPVAPEEASSANPVAPVLAVVSHP